MQKAVLITKSNIDALTQRFNPEEQHEPLVVGYFLVTDFGSQDENYDLVTLVALRTAFHIVGEVRLLNDFFEVVKKA